MSDDRSGIDRLRAAVDEVAAGLAPPSARPRKRRVPMPGVLAALAIVVVGAWWWAAVRRSDDSTAVPPSAASLGIEIKHLRLDGRDVDARVFEAAGAGTIVVAPRERPRRVTGPAAALLQGGR